MLSARIQSRLATAVAAVLPDVPSHEVQLRPSEPRFGDFQCTSLVALARRRGLNPRELAADVTARLDVADLCAGVDVSGPGFLNFRLRDGALAAAVDGAVRCEHRFFEPAAAPRTYVVDFSAPNVAKPMHVGHIRSTGIGDALVRLLRLLGHRVVTDNHIGDWGTQFGILLLGWKTRLDRAALAADPLAELERLYKELNEVCDPDKPGFDPAQREAAKAELVRLQAGDAENLAIWGEMQRLSQAQFDAIYARLGVRFDHALGESFYNRWLPEIVAELLAAGIARRSEDAVAVFSEAVFPDPAARPEAKQDPFLVKNRDGAWVDYPALIQKSDGGFNYMTTDLATIRHRLREWQPDEVVYVVDDRQASHFRQLFAIAARWLPEVAAGGARLTHVGFGKICGPDGKPLRTRAGGTVKLADLLDEAEERALAIVTAKNPDLPEAERRAIARVVGLGAVKYADLLPNRTSDYVFDWDKMLALQGNTAPYLQYAYARARSVLRKGGEGAVAGPVSLVEPVERALARHLLNFGFALEAAAAEFRPNLLGNYLYELAGLLAQFWEQCPVLKAEAPLRASRLALCDVTGRVLKEGLNTLGIEVLERM
ncbi:MAG: arginine--tRNA ligase [Limisphaerales bacterium]